MQLTKPQRLLLGRMLKEKVGEFPACTACRNATGWSIGGHLVRLPHADGGAAGPPLVSFTCSKCGHVLLFNAQVLGILDAPTEE